MAQNLFELAKSYLTPDMLRRFSSAVDEDPADTQRAFDAAVPALVGGFAASAASPSGASRLMNLIDSGGYDRMLPNFGDMLSGASLSNLSGSGSSILRTLFGERLNTVTDSVADQAGVRQSSLSKLMSLAAPLLLGLIGREVQTNRLSSSGLASMLANQKAAIGRMLPDRLAGLLNLGAAPEFAEARHIDRTAVAAHRGGVGRWLWPLLLLGAVLALWAFWRRPEVREAGRVALPGGIKLTLPENSLNYHLARYLGNPSDVEVPKRFTFDRLNFETGSARIMPDSARTIADLAIILKAHPSTYIRLEGHTDNTGDAMANRTLSLERANSVKNMLVQEGVGADRISTAGMGADQPLASNADEAGRERNRRTELVVTAK